MDLTAIASIIVAGVAAASAYASQRAAAKASRDNTNTSSRTDMEKEAYDRARRYDTDTIGRQDGELDELRAEVIVLRNEKKALQAELDDARRELRMVNVQNAALLLELPLNTNLEGHNPHG